MFTIIMGKTASGKDTVVNKLVSEYDLKKIITYTTREPRENEIQDITYHFISEKEFKQKIEEGFFVEWKAFERVDGIKYYGTAFEDLEKADDNSIVILTPSGFRDVVDKLSVEFKSIYLYANNPTIKKRLVIRGDNKDEADRRVREDNTDFKGVENEVDKIVFNNDGTQIEDVINKILELIKE